MKTYLIYILLILALFSICSCSKKEVNEKDALTYLICQRCGGTGNCQVCDGTGRNIQGDACPVCDGTRKCFYCNGQGYY